MCVRREVFPKEILACHLAVFMLEMVKACLPTPVSPTTDMDSSIVFTRGMGTKIKQGQANTLGAYTNRPIRAFYVVSECSAIAQNS